MSSSPDSKLATAVLWKQVQTFYQRQNSIRITVAFNITMALVEILSMGTWTLHIAPIGVVVSIAALFATPQERFHRRAAISTFYGSLASILGAAAIKVFAMDADAPVVLNLFGYFVSYAWFIIPGLMVSAWFNWDRGRRLEDAL